MENFIPFLIGIALFIYKVWSNFQKEQVKARKRNPARPGSSETKTAEHGRGMRNTVPTPTKNPQPFLLEEITDNSNPYEPKYKHLYERERPGGKEYNDKVNESGNREVLITKEGYNPEQVAEEIRTNRRIHRAHKHQQAPSPEEEDAPVQFDMKSAVIAEAILNRPQY